MTSETVMMDDSQIRSAIDQIWESFWAGGISNPLEVIEQLTYLLFIKRLDELHTLALNKERRTKKRSESRVFPDGTDDKDVDYEDYRWSNFRHFDAPKMMSVVEDHVFPFIRNMGDEGSSFEKHMEGARFTIPTASLLKRAVEGLDRIPMTGRDTKGDLYEYMLSKIASAGQNGQFRTPRHIIELMVEMTAPSVTNGDTVCDPACGTAGFLTVASEYVRRNDGEALVRPEHSSHFATGMFTGFDFDRTMLRIGNMNMVLHGVENADISYKDSLTDESTEDIGRFSVILANPPFAGSLDSDMISKTLTRTVKTKKTELLFLARFLEMLQVGGRAAVIVPDGVLFGSTKAHKELRRILVEDQKLNGIVSLPSGVFKPYAGVSTAILLFTKTDKGGTENVWFYDLEEDGYSLNDKRDPAFDDESKLGPLAELTEDEHEKNNLPDALTRWKQRDDASEVERERTEQSFCVPKDEIADKGHDLSINSYKKIVYEEVDYPAPSEIIAELEELEGEITQGLAELKAMLG